MVIIMGQEPKLNLTGKSTRELQALRYKTGKDAVTGAVHGLPDGDFCPKRHAIIQKARASLRQTVSNVLESRTDKDNDGPITIGGL
jgi:hypothetical protein